MCIDGQEVKDQKHLAGQPLRKPFSASCVAETVSFRLSKCYFMIPKRVQWILNDFSNENSDFLFKNPRFASNDHCVDRNH